MNQQDSLYTESQRFDQWWIWGIVLIAPLVFCWLIYRQIILGLEVGDNPLPDLFLFAIALVLGVGPVALIYACRLDTVVTGEGLFIRFRPFYRRWVEFLHPDVLELEAATYRGLRDYGGWGIRYGARGKAYTVRGDQGVMLRLSDGKNCMIGSQNVESFMCAMLRDG